MPFVKSAEGKVCLALEPEIKNLLDKGFQILTDVEEAAQRRELSLNQELTSFTAQEKARIEAGLYAAIYPTDGAVGENAVSVPQNVPAAGSGGVDASAAQDATAPATSQLSTPGDSQPLSDGSNANVPADSQTVASGEVVVPAPDPLPASEPEATETPDNDADDTAKAQDSTNGAA